MGASNTLTAFFSCRLPLLGSVFLFILSCSYPDQDKEKGFEQRFKERCFGAELIVRTEKPLEKAMTDSLSTLIEEVTEGSSLLKSSSELQRFCSAKRGIVLKGKSEQHLKRLILKAKNLHDRTDGAFDPSVAPLIEYWRQKGTDMESITSADEVFIDSVITFVGFEKIRLKEDSLIKEDPRARIDLSGIERGYLLEKVGRTLCHFGLKPYLLKLGNKYRSRGGSHQKKGQKFPVQYPLRDLEDQRVAWLELEQNPASIATAGDFQKFYTSQGKRYSATIDPETGRPAQSRVLSVTVVGSNSTLVDGLGTAYMVMGKEPAYHHASDRKNIEAFFVLSGENKDIRMKGTEGISFSGGFHGLPSAVAKDEP